MAESKPKGWQAFHALAKRVVAVPKSKVDAAIAQKREPTPNPPKIFTQQAMKGTKDKKIDGGSAFPTQGAFDSNGQLTMFGEDGMSLRDWFAGQSLTGLMTTKVDADSASIARLAYELADAMLAEQVKMDFLREE